MCKRERERESERKEEREREQERKSKREKESESERETKKHFTRWMVCGKSSQNISFTNLVISIIYHHI